MQGVDAASRHRGGEEAEERGGWGSWSTEKHAAGGWGWGIGIGGREARGGSGRNNTNYNEE